MSVRNLNIRGRESSQGDFKAQSGKSNVRSLAQIFNMSELLHYAAPRSGPWKCPSAGYVQCPIMSELK